MTSLFRSSKLKIPNILLFGAPGAGKGTYGSLLEEDLTFKKISTGDQIRSFLKKGNLSKDLEEIKEICKSGGLINDKMIMNIIIDGVKEASNYKGILFDGFPRNKEQAIMFSENFDTDLSYVVNWILNEDILVEKLAGRRVCEDCGSNYNLWSINRDGYFMKPLMPKNGCSCDKCGGKLVQREDDIEETIRSRLNIYQRETEPLLEIFDKLGMKILNFEPKKGIQDYPTLLAHLEEDYLHKIKNFDRAFLENV